MEATVHDLIKLCACVNNSGFPGCYSQSIGSSDKLELIAHAGGTQQLMLMHGFTVTVYHSMSMDHTATEEVAERQCKSSAGGE